MEVILLERVEKLGQMGDKVRVKPGFGRNYLLPQKKALRATKENEAFFQQQKNRLEADNLERKVDAEKVAKKIEGLTLILIRQSGDSGQLYGSVSVKDIADMMKQKENVIVARQQVHLANPIKTVGISEAKIYLHPEVSVIVKLNVARSEEEAELQAKEASKPPVEVKAPKSEKTAQEAVEEVASVEVEAEAE